MGYFWCRAYQFFQILLVPMQYRAILVTPTESCSVLHLISVPHSWQDFAVVKDSVATAAATNGNCSSILLEEWSTCQQSSGGPVKTCPSSLGLRPLASGRFLPTHPRSAGRFITVWRPAVHSSCLMGFGRGILWPKWVQQKCRWDLWGDILITHTPLYVIFASKPVVWLHWNETPYHLDNHTSKNLGDHSN